MLVEVCRDEKGCAGFPLSSFKIPLALKDTPESLALRHGNDKRQALALSIESYLRRMIARCALRINIPYSPDQEWIRPRMLKSLLSPTTKKSIRFVDRQEQYWRTVLAYLKPISNKIGPNPKLSQLAWNLYLLILSAKYKSEVVLPPGKTLSLLSELEKDAHFDTEGLARLSVLAGLFNCFEPTTEGPTLRFLPNSHKFAVSERIEEILEDAYLLEASQLRRFLGIKQNITAIKRDLRKLLTYISKERSWAKGLLGIGSSTILGGDASAKVLEKLSVLLPTLELGSDPPVLTDVGEQLFGEQEACIDVIRGIGENLFHLDSHRKTQLQNEET